MKKKINKYSMEIQKWQKQIRNRNRRITDLHIQMCQNGCGNTICPNNQKLRQPRKPSKLTSPRKRRRPRPRPRTTQNRQPGARQGPK